MSAPILELRDLVKRYDGQAALSGVSLTVREGEIFALLGPNGAGKTTLISIVCGLVMKTSGMVKLFGEELESDPFGLRRQVGLVPQEMNVDPFFTVREALEIQLGHYGKKKSEGRVQEVLEALELQKKANHYPRALSGGMRRRLLIGKALVHRPRLVFLDEPTAGVDVELRKDLWRYVRRLKAEGTTVILTTHYLEEAEELADRVGILDGGRLLLVEETGALMKRLGEKRLEVTLGATVTALPELVAMEGVTLSGDGRTLSYLERDGQTACGDVLHALYRAGLPVMDVETRRSRLEDVLLDILHGKAAPRGEERMPPAVADALPGEVTAPARRGSPRRTVNTVGLRTLLVREILRFIRIPVQTVLAPLISTTLYFIVFGYSLGGSARLVHGLPYLRFIVPGLVFLSIANNAFQNASLGLVTQKLQNTLVDLLVAPLGPLELMSGYIGASVVRGLSVGLMTWGVATLFNGASLPHALPAVGFLFLIAYVFSMLGLLVAIWAERIENVGLFPMFVMMPLTFLGGVFYSVQDLPAPWRTLSLFNPVVYMVEGLRYGMIGQSPLSPLIGGSFLLTIAVVATALVAWALRVGYKLRG